MPIGIHGYTYEPLAKVTEELIFKKLSLIGAPMLR
jgi:hypothetical protein